MKRIMFILGVSIIMALLTVTAALQVGGSERLCL